jgi:hypothetical protein
MPTKPNAEDVTPEETAPEETALEETAPEESAPEETPARKPPAKAAKPAKPAAVGTAPAKTAPTKAAPAKTGTAKNAPAKTAPAKAQPADGASAKATPTKAKPKSAAAKSAATADAAPAVVEPALPEGSPAETAPLPATEATAATTAVTSTEATTEVIDPVAAPGASTAAQRTVVIEPAPRKRKRWPWILLIVLVVLAGLLIAAFFIAERYVREYAENYAREQIVSVLSLPEDTPVRVTLGEGSIILQALSGAIGEVNVEADGVTFGELTGDAAITATRVPLDGTQPVETLDITMTIAEENVRTLAGSLSGLELDSIELQDGVIAISSEFTIFNIVRIPVGVDLAPAAQDGAITFDPVTIYLGEDPISVADLRDSPEFSGFAGALLQTQTVCVANSLPQALTVVDVRVVGSDLVVKVNGDDTPLSGPGLSTMGTCE